MELPGATRRHLLEQPGVRGYVQDGVYKHRLLDHVNGTGGRAVVVRMAGGWDKPDHTQTSQYPLLAVDCWADCSRDEHGDRSAEDCLDNAWALYRAVDDVLHQARNALWGASQSDPEGAYVVSCIRSQEPYDQSGDAQAGSQSAAALPYAVDLGECAVVTVQYEVWLA
jgi:hypothetical protein